MHLPKFEDTSALKHHCGICQTPFSNPSALLTCVGKHEVLCTSYHPMFHFIGKEHTCHACNKTEKMQTERHRTILKLLKSYREENQEDISSNYELLSSPAASPYADKMRKKERKAQKKATRNNIKLDIIKQSDLEALKNAIYPPDDAAEDADKFLADALALKYFPTVFSEKRMLDTLMSLPSDTPDLEAEADRVVLAMAIGKPQSKEARSLLLKIKKAIEQDMKAQWDTDFNMRKRRIMYAQWVTQGAIDNIGKQHEPLEANTRAGARRYRGDDRVTKSKENTRQYEDELDSGTDEFDDDIPEFAGLSLADPFNSSTCKDAGIKTPIKLQQPSFSEKSPLNDTRRGGKALHPLRYSRLQSVPGQINWQDENDTTAKLISATTRSVASSHSHGSLGPEFAPEEKSSIDLSLTSLDTISPNPSSFAGALPPTSLNLSSTPDSSWRIDSSTASLNTLARNSLQTGNINIPQATVIKSLRVIPSKKQVDEVRENTFDGTWSTVSKKGKAQLVMG